jgi:hypothetical protein
MTYPERFNDSASNSDEAYTAKNDWMIAPLKALGICQLVNQSRHEHFPIPLLLLLLPLPLTD